MSILVPALAAVVAAALTFLIVRGRAAQAQIGELRHALAQRDEELARLRVEHAAMSQDNAWLTQDLSRQKDALGSTQALADRLQQTLRDTFQSLAGEALRDNRASFFDLARTSFE